MPALHAQATLSADPTTYPRVTAATTGDTMPSSPLPLHARPRRKPPWRSPTACYGPAASCLSWRWTQPRPRSSASAGKYGSSSDTAAQHPRARLGYLQGATCRNMLLSLHLTALAAAHNYRMRCLPRSLPHSSCHLPDCYLLSQPQFAEYYQQPIRLHRVQVNRAVASGVR